MMSMAAYPITIYWMDCEQTVPEVNEKVWLCNPDKKWFGSGYYSNRGVWVIVDAGWQRIQPTLWAYPSFPTKG